jgi:hypothetical protein
MSSVEEFCAMQVHLQKLNHFFQVNLLLLIQAESLNRQFNPHCQFRTTCPKHYLGTFVNDAGLDNGLVRTHHAHHLQRNLVEIKRLFEKDMGH